MKKLYNIIKLPLALIFLIISCSKSDSDIDDKTGNTSVMGTIQLSGEDTSETGTSLVVGNIAVGKANLTGTTESIVLLDKSINLTDDELVFNDLENNFVIVAADFDKESTTIDKTISINISVNGKEFKYACSTPEFSFTDCGTNYKIDFTKKEVIFDNTTVINVDTDKILTLNGTVTWK